MKLPSTTPLRSATTRLAVATLAVVAADQASKALTSAHPGTHLLPVRNPAFSLGLASASRWAEIAAMTLGMAVAVAFLMPRVRRGRVHLWAAAALLGGAAGNLLDRVVFGSVRDFFPLGPVVLNGADVAVLVGLTALLLTRAVRHQPAAPPAHPTLEGR